MKNVCCFVISYILTNNVFIFPLPCFFVAEGLLVDMVPADDEE